MAKTKMGVVGCGGRMGRMLVAEIAATEGCTIAGGSEAPGSGYVNQDIGELAGIGRIGIPIGEAVDKLIRDSDVVLEFTSPAATAEHAALAAGLGKAMVIGTTGLSPEQGDVVRQAARDIPIVWAPNMSLGVNVLLSVVEKAARRLGPDWDIEIMEMHHRGKVDAPSGTAIASAKRMAEARLEQGAGPWPADRTEKQTLEGSRGAVGPGGLHVHSVRIPGLVAHQEVILGAVGQSLTIRHDAYDRTSFMPGVLLALRSVPNLEGLTVGLDSVLGLQGRPS